MSFFNVFSIVTIIYKSLFQHANEVLKLHQHKKQCIMWFLILKLLLDLM